MYILHVFPKKLKKRTSGFGFSDKEIKKCVHGTQLPPRLVNRKLMCGIHESCTHDTTHHAEAAYLILSHKWLLSFSEWEIRTDGRTDRRLNLMPPMPYPWGHNNDTNYCICYRVRNSSLTVCL